MLWLKYFSEKVLMLFVGIKFVSQQSILYQYQLRELSGPGQGEMDQDISRVQWADKLLTRNSNNLTPPDAAQTQDKVLSIDLPNES